MAPVFMWCVFLCDHGVSPTLLWAVSRKYIVTVPCEVICEHSTFKLRKRENSQLTTREVGYIARVVTKGGKGDIETNLKHVEY